MAALSSPYSQARIRDPTRGWQMAPQRSWAMGLSGGAVSGSRSIATGSGLRGRRASSWRSCPCSVTKIGQPVTGLVVRSRAGELGHGLDADEVGAREAGAVLAEQERVLRTVAAQVEQGEGHVERLLRLLQVLDLPGGMGRWLNRATSLVAGVTARLASVHCSANVLGWLLDATDP